MHVFSLANQVKFWVEAMPTDSSFNLNAGKHRPMNVVTSNKPEGKDLVTFAGSLSVLAMWHSAPFQVGGHAFSSVGQFLAWSKAIALGEFMVADAIYEAETREEAQAYSRSLTECVADSWKSMRHALAAQGAYAKFSQNPVLGAKLLSTGDALLVEVSPFDTYWSSGMDAFDRRLEMTHPSQWPGENVWGGALTATRETLRQRSLVSSAKAV